MMAAKAGHAEQAALSPVDAGALESLGGDVVASICAARDLLKNQTAVLFGYHKSLQSYHNGVMAKQAECERKNADLEQKAAEVAATTRECERLIKERESASANLLALRRRMDAELQKIDENEPDPPSR